MHVFLQEDSTVQFHADNTYFRQSDDAAGKRSVESREYLELDPKKETPEKPFRVSS
jgi:hypothetical protein